MKTVVVLLVALALVATPSWAGGPAGDPQGLRGVFALSGVRTCVQSAPLTQAAPDGFDPDFRLLLPGSTRSAHIAGTVTLNGDGTGLMLFRSLQIFNHSVAVGQQPVSVASNRCEVTYGANPDGTYWLDTHDCTAELEAGAGAGTTAEVLNAGPMTVAVAPDRQFLQMVDVGAMVERSVQSPPTRSFDRVCGRSYTAVLLGRGVGRR